MRKLTPCPSPRGTNYERLFIVRAPTRMALDQAFEPDIGAPETNSVQQAYADVYTMIQATGDDALMAAFNHYVDCMAEANGGGAMDDEPSAVGVSSANPKVGRIEPNPPGASGQAYASDSAIIRRAQAQAGKARTASALKGIADFNARFPNAARLRNV